MTVITHPSPIALDAPAQTAPRYFAAPDAFRVLRAWRAWAPRSGDRATTGFALLRSDAGSLLLASENFDAESIDAIAGEGYRRLLPVAEPPTARPERDGARAVAFLQSLDDWAIEVLLRTAAAICGSLVVGLRHREGRFELVAWPREAAADPAGDADQLLAALTPWVAR